MSKKPFYNLMWYTYERSRYNPLRYILGKTAITKDAKKAWRKQCFEASDFEIIPMEHADRNKAILMKKVFDDWWSKNPQMSDQLKAHIDKYYE